MARRYSGDAEVRVGWDARKREYRGIVRDPYRRVHVALKPDKIPREPASPEAYDEAAARMIAEAERRSGRKIQAERRRGHIVVQRMFQAPCPLEDDL